MSRTHTTLAIPVTVLGVILTCGVPFAASLPDATEAFFNVVTDTPERFRAVGTWSSIDRTVPPNNFDQPLPNYTIPNTVNWVFRIGKRIPNWRIAPPIPTRDNGANNDNSMVEGQHLHGPHAGIDADPNTLPRIFAVGVPSIDIYFDTKKAAILTAQNSVRHPTTNSAQHWDHYGMQQRATALEGPPHKVCGPTEVVAKHTGSTKETQLFGATVGSSSAAGAKASYNSATGRITLHFGALDIFNRTGSTVPGIEVAYVGDPMLNTSIADLVLQLVGPTGDGGFRFTGTMASLSDPESQVQMKGRFTEYLIYDTSRTGVIDSYAIFRELVTADVGGDCASPFLAGFVEDNVTGGSLPEPVWLNLQGTCLTFSTAADLSALTAGFTTSVSDIPATITLSASMMFGTP